jgi:hypothetical protein
MKKTLPILAILFLLLTQKTNAQLEKGNVLFGADLANLKIGLKEGAATAIQLSPKAGWFIKSNVAIGPYVSFGYVTQKTGGVTSSSTTYSVGAFGRYYVVNDPKANLLKQGRWFFEANAGIGGQNTKGGNSTNGLELGFGPGYAYFVTPSVGLETLLKWNPIIGFGNETFTSNLSLNFGFLIYLPGKATLNSVKEQETK